jgi:hypothetical protein
MNELIVVPKNTEWQRLKRLVLDSVSSPITKRVYSLGLDEFFAWYAKEPRPGFTKATVSAWRVGLETRGLGSVSNQHSDNGGPETGGGGGGQWVAGARAGDRNITEGHPQGAGSAKHLSARFDVSYCVAFGVSVQRKKDYCIESMS